LKVDAWAIIKAKKVKVRKGKNGTFDSKKELLNKISKKFAFVCFNHAKKPKKAENRQNSTILSAIHIERMRKSSLLVWFYMNL